MDGEGEVNSGGITKENEDDGGDAGDGGGGGGEEFGEDPNEDVILLKLNPAQILQWKRLIPCLCHSSRDGMARLEVDGSNFTLMVNDAETHMVAHLHLKREAFSMFHCGGTRTLDKMLWLTTFGLFLYTADTDEELCIIHIKGSNKLTLKLGHPGEDYGRPDKLRDFNLFEVPPDTERPTIMLLCDATLPSSFLRNLIDNLDGTSQQGGFLCVKCLYFIHLLLLLLV